MSVRVGDMRIWLAVGALALALGVSGCGRKGGLEAPPDASVEGQPKTLTEGTAPPRGTGKDRPFILDGLL